MVNTNVIAALVVIVIIIAVVGLFGMDLGVPDTTGHVTGTAQVTVNSTAAISLPVSTVNFGTMNIDEINDTSNDTPPPFQVQNDGNDNVNITIYADNMWTLSGYNNPTANYQFMCGTGDAACPAGSVTSFTNMPNSTNATLVIANLSYVEGSDMLEIDINVTVPSDEVPEGKSSTVTLTASQS